MEDSALGNLEVDDNFYPPETAAYKFVESHDETGPEEISSKRTSPTSLATLNAKKQKSTTSITSCDIPNKSECVMSNVKGIG